MRKSAGYPVILVLAVMLPRLAWFSILQGELPEPSRDQPIYLRMAGSIVQGRGLSFDRSMALMKNAAGDDEDNILLNIWSGRSDYVFGLTPVDTPTATVEPGYPLLLAAIFLLTGPVAGAVFLLNCIVSLAGAWAVWRMVTRQWGKTEGYIVSLIWAVYPWYVYYSAYAMSESVHISLLPLILMYLFRITDGKGGGFLTGVATGFLFLVRSTALFLIPVELAYLFLMKRRRAIPAMLAGFVVCAAPWVARNQLVMGSPVLLPTKGSLNLWMRNHPGVLELEGISIPRWIEISREDLLEYPDFDTAEGELDRSRYLSTRAISFISANPGMFLWLCGDRMLRFLSPFGMTASGSTAGVISAFTGLLVYLPMMLLSCIEFWRRRKNPSVQLIVSVFVLYTVLHALAHGGIRYRLPVDLVPMIGASLFISRKAGIGSDLSKTAQTIY